MTGIVNRTCAAALVAAAVLLAGGLVGEGPAGPASAETVAALPAPGALYHTFITVAQKQIPLPSGWWQVAGSGDEDLTGAAPGAYGVIESLVLVKLEGRTVESFVVIHTNALEVDRGWGTNSECAARVLPLARIYDEAGSNLLCAFGGPVSIRRDAGAPPFWRQALDMAFARTWTIPEHWLMAGFRISDRHDVVEVRYHYQPTVPQMARQERPSGVIAASSPGPGMGVVSAAPDRGGPWLPTLAGWLEAMKAPVEQGFRGHLSSRQDSLLLPSEGSVSRGAALDKAVPAETDALTALFQRSVIKMLSWKVIGVSAGFTIKYLFIGNLSTAASLQVATSVVTGVLYVGYDMLWATVFPDRRKPVIDFSSATVSS